MTLKRMDNVGIVVESLDAAISFFAELGLRLEGRAMIEGEWAGRVTGLGTQRVEIAMMVTPDGHSRLELSRFLTPPVVADHRNAPVNALGYLRVMFTVDDIDETLARLRKHGAQLVGEVVQYEEAYRLCYIRGPEGLLIGLAEELRCVSKLNGVLYAVFVPTQQHFKEKTPNERIDPYSAERRHRLRCLHHDLTRLQQAAQSASEEGGNDGP